MRLRPESGPKDVRLAGDVDDLAADGERPLRGRVVADAVAQVVLELADVARRDRR